MTASVTLEQVATLATQLSPTDRLRLVERIVHDLAVPPAAFESITQGIGAHGLAERSRIVYEKPFGMSSKSFHELDRAAHAVFKERQIYRIDHFLGKEATQDIHVLRFANGLFSSTFL